MLGGVPWQARPGFFGDFKAIPQAVGGSLPLTAPATTGPNALFNSNPLLPGLTNNNATRVRDMLNFFAGSLSQVSQLYFLTDAQKLDAWSDFRDSRLITTTSKQREFDVFFKDDYKVTKDLTLNLGLRYEKYGVPFVASGLTVSCRRRRRCVWHLGT